MYTLCTLSSPIYTYGRMYTSRLVLFSSPTNLFLSNTSPSTPDDCIMQHILDLSGLSGIVELCHTVLVHNVFFLYCYCCGLSGLSGIV